MGFRVGEAVADSWTPFDDVVVFCAGCGRQLSNLAVACPQCGRPTGVGLYPPPQPPFGSTAAERMLLPVGRSGLAIAAGYVALFAVVIFPLAPIALVLGLLAIRVIRRDPQKHGMGRAIFAVLVGMLWVTVFLVLIVVGQLGG